MDIATFSVAESCSFKDNLFGIQASGYCVFNYCDSMKTTIFIPLYTFSLMKLNNFSVSTFDIWCSKAIYQFQPLILDVLNAVRG
jgi:hypothetical protein